MTTTATTAPDRLGDTIIRISSSEWMVKSRRSAPGAYWRVQTSQADEPICGCLGNAGLTPADSDRHRRACHHFRVAVDFEIKRDRIAHPPRDLGAPAPGSMFVD